MTFSVVVVDDEYWIRSLVCSYLPSEDEGFVLLGEARDGIDGLELCQRVNPDILITDIKMPGFGGLELLEAVKQMSPDTQVIIISGYEEFEFARRAMKNGVLDYLIKPIEKSSVHKALFQAAGILKEIQTEKKQITEMQNKVQRLENIFSSSCELPTIQDKRIQRAINFIYNNYSSDISLDEAASEATMNPNYFSECFRNKMGQGFCDFLTLYRLQKAAELLLNPELKIREIAQQTGFRDPNYFSRIFKKATGHSPSECRNNNINIESLVRGTTTSLR